MPEKQSRQNQVEGHDQTELDEEHAIELPERTALSIIEPGSAGAMPVPISTVDGSGVVDPSATPPPSITIDDAPPPEAIGTLPPQ